MADNPDCFALPKLKRYAVKDRDFAVAGMQIRDLEYDAIRLGVFAAGIPANIGLAAFANTHARFPK